MSRNNLSNFHICIGDDGLERVNYLRGLGYMRSPNNRPYLPSSALIMEPKHLMEHHYPDPIAAIREKLRAIDRQYLRSTPYVSKVHGSWVVTWPVGDWHEIKHEIAIFSKWDDAMLVANWMAANG